MLEVSSLMILELWKSILLLVLINPINPKKFLNFTTFFIFLYHIINHILTISILIFA